MTEWAFRCPTCHDMQPLSAFERATWQSPAEELNEACATCTERERLYWAGKLTKYFRYLIAVGELAPGYRYVRWPRVKVRRYRPRVTIDGVRRYIGSYATKEEAADAHTRFREGRWAA